MILIRIALAYILGVLFVFGLQIAIRPRVQKWFDPTDLYDVLAAAGVSFSWPFILVVVLVALPFALVWVIARKVAKEE